MSGISAASLVGLISPKSLLIHMCINKDLCTEICGYVLLLFG